MLYPDQANSTDISQRPKWVFLFAPYLYFFYNYIIYNWLTLLIALLLAVCWSKLSSIVLMEYVPIWPFFTQTLKGSLFFLGLDYILAHGYLFCYQIFHPFFSSKVLLESRWTTEILFIRIDFIPLIVSNVIMVVLNFIVCITLAQNSR